MSDDPTAPDTPAAEGGTVDRNAGDRAPLASRSGEPSPPAGHRAQPADDDLHCLLQVVQDLASAEDLESGFEALALPLRSLVPFDNLAILLADDLGRDLSFAFTIGYREDVTAHWRFGMGQGVVGTVAQSRRPLLVDDVTRESRYIQACEGTRSELAVPLVSKQRTVGVLDVGSRRAGAFGSEHLHLLQLLAGYLGTAIDNARLYQNTREQARGLSLLHEVSRELASILDRQRLLERVAELVARLIDYDFFGVLRWDEASRSLLPSVLRGPGTRGAEPALAPLPIGSGICGTVAALRQPLRVPNVQLDPRYVRCIETLEVRSELAVPLLFEDQLLGVLFLDSNRYDAFSEQHEQLLATLASSLAIALENARLFEQVRREEERLEADLATAREIQKQLLPASSPWIPGLQVGFAYAPARHLGGDFYQFLPLGEGRLAIALGDVAGKATSAALYGSMAIGILRETVLQTKLDPAGTLRHLSGRLHQLDVGNRFLALLFAHYEADSRRLTLANSGLPLPFLVRQGNSRQIDVTGVPLGILAPRGYAQVEIELEPGDLVVLASDGVEEARDGDEREFGAIGVEATLRVLADQPAEAIARGLVAAADLHARTPEPGDDRTVVVLKVPREDV